jgi:hypothetical protein
MDTRAENVSSRPFGEILGLWAKVFQMDEAFFAAEAPRTSSRNTLIAVLIYAAFNEIIAILAPTTVEPGSPSIARVMSLIPLLSLVIIPAGYYLGIGLTHWSARRLKGQGSFATLAYLESLFFIPLSIAAVTATLIPRVGLLLALPFSLYALFLTVRALKVTYQFTTSGTAVKVIALVVALALVFSFLINGLVILAQVIGMI